MKEIRRFVQSKIIQYKEEKGQMLISTIEKMVYLSKIARREGLLALESAASEPDALPNYKFLSAMILFIVDGTEPDFIEEVSLARYCSAGLEAYDALQYLVFLVGSLALQNGENPRMIEEKLLVLIPEDISEEYREKQKEKEKKKNQEQQPEQGQNLAAEAESLDLSFLEKYYEGDIAATYGEDEYFLLKVTDYAVKSLDDRAMQRVLRDVDNYKLVLAMRGWSGEARHKIFKNLSKRLAVMIGEDMNFMRAVRMRDVFSAAYNIFTVIIKLMDAGEIYASEGDALQCFYRIFRTLVEDTKSHEIVYEAESKLQKILSEYSKKNNRILKC